MLVPSGLCGIHKLRHVFIVGSLLNCSSEWTRVGACTHDVFSGDARNVPATVRHVWLKGARDPGCQCTHHQDSGLFLKYVGLQSLNPKPQVEVSQNKGTPI